MRTPFSAIHPVPSPPFCPGRNAGWWWRKKPSEILLHWIQTLGNPLLKMNWIFPWIVHHAFFNITQALYLIISLVNPLLQSIPWTVKPQKHPSAKLFLNSGRGRCTLFFYPWCYMQQIEAFEVFAVENEKEILFCVIHTNIIPNMVPKIHKHRTLSF